MDYSQTPFVKYDDIEEITCKKDISLAIDGNVEVFEKIDGGNCQVRKINGQLFAGNRANYLKGPIAKILWFPKLLKWMYSNPTLYNLPESIIPFGEFMGNHTINYDPENVDKFFLIDVFDLEKKRFLEYDSAKNFIQSLGIEDIHFLEPLAKGKIGQKDIVALLTKNSQYYSGPKEGIVIKNYDADPQRFYKVLNFGFEEQREVRFGQNDPFTEARVRKAIFRGVEQYDMSGLTFEGLYELIRKDVKKETGKDYPIDFIKKKVIPHLKIMFQRQGVKFIPQKP